MLTIKIFLFTIVITFAALRIYAQARVTSTIIGKENRSAVMIQIDQSVDITTGALEQRMKHSGLNGKTQGVVTTYKEVTLSEIANEKVDIYTKIEEGENRNSSVVYMTVSKGYNNFTNAESDSMITEHIKIFLNSFVKDVSVFSVDLLITDQMNAVSSEEKEYENLLKDQKELEKKKADIENNLIEKDKEIREKLKDLDLKRAALEELKRNRTGLN